MNSNITAHYSASECVKRLIKKFPLHIQCVQIDNAGKFTNRFTCNYKMAMFKNTLKTFGIDYKLIRPSTPRLTEKLNVCIEKTTNILTHHKSFILFRLL